MGTPYTVQIASHEIHYALCTVHPVPHYALCNLHNKITLHFARHTIVEMHRCAGSFLHLANYAASKNFVNTVQFLAQGDSLQRVAVIYYWRMCFLISVVTRVPRGPHFLFIASGD